MAGKDGNGHTSERSERHGLSADVDVNLSDSVEGKAYTAHAINVSAGGCCLKTDAPLEKSQVIQLRLRLTATDAALPVSAEVCWVDTLAGNRGYLVGLRFIDEEPL